MAISSSSRAVNLSRLRSSSALLVPHVEPGSAPHHKRSPASRRHQPRQEATGGSVNHRSPSLDAFPLPRHRRRRSDAMPIAPSPDSPPLDRVGLHSLRQLPTLFHVLQETPSLLARSHRRRAPGSPGSPRRSLPSWTSPHGPPVGVGRPARRGTRLAPRPRPNPGRIALAVLRRSFASQLYARWADSLGRALGSIV